MLSYRNKYLKYKNKYLLLKQVGGNNYNGQTFNIDNIIKYKEFIYKLKDIIENSEITQINTSDLKTYEKFKELGNCDTFNDVINEIELFASSSNPVYIGNVKKDYINDYVYIKNLNKVIMKVCDGDIYNLEILKPEILALLNLSLLVINNISSNFLIFFGLKFNCNFTYLEKKTKKNYDDINFILITNYIHGETLYKLHSHSYKLDDRQIFEYLYSIICCYVNYNTFSGDNSLNNIMMFEDKLYTHITITNLNKSLFFCSNNSICFIDCNFEASKYDPDTIINIGQHINTIINLISDFNPKKNKIRLMEKDTHINLLKTLISIFDDYIYNDTKLPDNCRNIIFNCL